MTIEAYNLMRAAESVNNCGDNRSFRRFGSLRIRICRHSNALS